MLGGLHGGSLLRFVPVQTTIIITITTKAGGMDEGITTDTEEEVIMVEEGVTEEITTTWDGVQGAVFAKEFILALFV